MLCTILGTRDTGVNKKDKNEISFLMAPASWQAVCLCVPAHSGSGEQASREGWWSPGGAGVAILNRQSGNSSLGRWQLSELKEVREWDRGDACLKTTSGRGNILV